MKTLAKCNRAGTLKRCKTCGHAVPHERDTLKVPLIPCLISYCGSWRGCWDGPDGPAGRDAPRIKARCVRVKEE